MALERCRYLLPVQSYGGYHKMEKWHFLTKIKIAKVNFRKKSTVERRTQVLVHVKILGKSTVHILRKLESNIFSHHPHRPPLLSTPTVKFTHIRKSHCIGLLGQWTLENIRCTRDPQPHRFCTGDVKCGELRTS